MYKIGDKVFFEDYNADDDEISIFEGSVVEINQDQSRKGVISNYYRTNRTTSWYSEDELFTTEYKLARHAMEQIKEDQKELFQDIQALEDEIKTSKKHLRDMDEKYRLLSLIKG
jgi:hypothetical protein